MEVTLRPVTPENYDECKALSLEKGQAHMLPSILKSLADSIVHPELRPLAIYAGEKVVGFMMHGIDWRDGNHWLQMLMIDRRHQRKGYGRKALELLIEHLRREGVTDTLYLSFTPDNTAARRLYESLGFCKTGGRVNGEIVARLDLQASRPVHKSGVWA